MLARAYFLVFALTASAFSWAGDAAPVRVLVWDEQQPTQKQVYLNFLGNQIAGHLKNLPGFEVTSVSMNDPHNGLTSEVLDKTDVLVWWGHVRHKELADDKALDIVRRIKEGKLSLIALHSAHWAKPYVDAMKERSIQDALGKLSEDERKSAKLTLVPYKGGVPKAGTPLTPSSELKKNADGSLELIVKLPGCIFPSWRADGAPSHVKTLLPDHPIAKGIPAQFDIPQTEMYNEPYHVPAPDEVIFEERWDKGEYFRAGMLWTVGKGKVFYFRPGHETYNVYKQELTLKILENACRYLGSK